MVLLISSSVFMAVVLMVSAIASFRVRPVRGRLAQYSEGGNALFSYQENLGRPLLEKVLMPLFMRLGKLVGRHTPANVMADIEKRLRQAGQPYGLTLNSFL